MEIKFTEEQYENLVKLVYLGNWMINAIRTDDVVEQYEDLEQYIYSFAEDAGLGKYIEYDQELEMFFPTGEFEENTDVEQYREDYDDENFWDELIYRLARRDFIEAYGEDAVMKMDLRERLEKEDPFIEKYYEEFEKYGIERLKIAQ
ncbi:MAG: hypothetical protein QME64_07010 [bacterium]|nr:hypothetical protein [bacterium]